MDDMTRSEIKFVKDLLLELFERAGNVAELWTDEGAQQICRLLLPFDNSRHLESALPSEGNPSGSFRDHSRFLFLDFVEKEKALPVLDMSWDLAAPRPMIRFRFFLLHWSDEDLKLRAVGFRLEPPEGAGGEGPGNHDYWHAQMISEFRKGDHILAKIVGASSEWIPTKQPTFPLPARRLGDLLAVLLVSIYGAKPLARLGSHVSLFSELAKRLREMGVQLTA